MYVAFKCNLGPKLTLLGLHLFTAYTYCNKWNNAHQTSPHCRALPPGELIDDPNTVVHLSLKLSNDYVEKLHTDYLKFYKPKC